MRFFKVCAVSLGAAVFIAAIALLSSGQCFENGREYSLFAGDTSKNCKEILSSNPTLDKLLIKDVCGECAVFDSLDVDGLLEQVSGKIVFEERLSDSVNYYCKADLPYSVQLYGEEINLHICVRKDSVKVASPIIFGGY